MAVASRAITFQFVESFWVPYTNETTGARGTPVALPANIEFTSAPAGNLLNQPHSGGRGDSITAGKGFDLTVTTAGFTPVVEAAVFGGAVATSGTTPAEQIAFTENTEDISPIGAWIGRVLNANSAGGDTVVIFEGTRFQNAAGYNANQDSLPTSALTATVQGHPVTKNTRKRIVRETAAALVAGSLPT